MRGRGAIWVHCRRVPQVYAQKLESELSDAMAEIEGRVPSRLLQAATPDAAAYTRAGVAGVGGVEGG